MSIDRRRLIGRHNPILTAFDPRSPLSVGNGELAFTADCTGLQTFPIDYEAGTPLCTQSQRGWHSFPGDGPAGVLRPQMFDTGGRPVPYWCGSSHTSSCVRPAGRSHLEVKVLYWPDRGNS